MGGPGSGAKPKTYAPELVQKVRDLYALGASQTEIAEATGITQKVVWRLMSRHGITARPAVKRDQTGSANSSWRGSTATYAALHKRVEVLRGTPKKCERCGLQDPDRRYEWANLNGRYDDPYDYERLCVPCHRRLDTQRRRQGVMPPCPNRRASV